MDALRAVVFLLLILGILGYASFVSEYLGEQAIEPLKPKLKQKKQTSKKKKQKSKGKK